MDVEVLPEKEIIKDVLGTVMGSGLTEVVLGSQVQYWAQA